MVYHHPKETTIFLNGGWLPGTSFDSHNSNFVQTPPVPFSMWEVVLHISSYDISFSHLTSKKNLLTCYIIVLYTSGVTIPPFNGGTSRGSACELRRPDPFLDRQEICEQRRSAKAGGATVAENWPNIPYWEPTFPSCSGVISDIYIYIYISHILKA